MEPPRLTPAEIPYRPEPAAPSQEALLERFRTSPEARQHMREMGYREGELAALPYETWQDCATMELLDELFTVGEQWTTTFGCRYFNWQGEFERKHPLLYKLYSSQWRYGMRADYGTAARHLNQLLALRAPAGLEFRLTWTLGSNETGQSVHARREGVKPNYLDGPLGLLVYSGPRLVMTVGLALCHAGVLVAQVQLREPTGNRWLYRLPGAREGLTYLDWILGVLGEGFPDDPLYLPTGTSVVEAVIRSYGRRPHSVTPEVAARLQRFYDQPLADWERTDQAEPYYHRDYRRLAPRTGRDPASP